MLDIGWSELAIIALVALVVIGPKDLPKAMKTVAHWIGKIRSLAHEFQLGVNEIVREAELDELRKDIDKAAAIDVKNAIGNTIDPDRSIERELDLAAGLHSPEAPASKEAEPGEAAQLPEKSEERTAEVAGAEAPSGTDDGAPKP